MNVSLAIANVLPKRSAESAFSAMVVTYGKSSHVLPGRAVPTEYAHLVSQVEVLASLEPSCASQRPHTTSALKMKTVSGLSAVSL